MTDQNNTVWENILSWQKDIRQKDEKLNKTKPLHEQVLPPIRAPVEYIIDQQKPLGLKTIKIKPQVPSTSSGTNTIATAIANTASKNTITTTTKTITQRALDAKEKGNKHFQQKQYQDAIKCYTEAIELDPTNATYFVNRAMAEIKLNRFLAAEKDCTKCISLQPNHVKALWRRGIARSGLGRPDEARQDFELALKIEPDNKAVTDELNKLPKPMTEQVKSKHTPKQHIIQDMSSDPMLRRLDINVIDEKYVPTKPVSNDKSDITESAVPLSKTANKTPSNEPNIDSAAPKKQQQPQKEIPASTKVASNTNILSPLKLKCPSTNYEFERDWKACKKRGDEALYQYLKCIPPASYPTLFKSSLEPDQFEKIIEIIHGYYLKNNESNDILQTMTGLSKIGRLDMLVMFLGKKHKTAIQDIFLHMKSDSTLDRTTLSTLAKRFSLDNI
ncbi:hypothetical protein BJ944DRAFT_272160 [Cunninghamella echinulata]|nr:hypothetical protein BJ944DRAFT_272160 [Cunninghamella echinulata]